MKRDLVRQWAIIYDAGTLLLRMFGRRPRLQNLLSRQATDVS